MRKLIITFIVLVWIGDKVSGQSIFSGGENSIGLRNYITTTRGMGMGSTGLALKDSVALNTYNIAAWRHINNSKINISAYYNYISSSVLNQKFSSSTARFNGVQLAVPIKKNRFVFGISIAPYSQVNFSYILKYPNYNPAYEENVFYEGNIARGQFNLTWSLNKNVGFAASLNYFFGTIEDRYYLFFNNSAISDDYYLLEYRLRGPGLGFSVDVTPFNFFRLGGFIDLDTRLNYYEIYQSSITLEEIETEKKANLPMFWGIGSSYQLGNQWVLNADIVYQDWSKGLQIRNNPDNLDDYYQIGIGMEHSHTAKRTRKILNKIDTRIGFRYGSTGNLVDGNPVKEYAGSLGVGIPFFQGNARFDLALIGGIRGDRNKTLAEEKFLKILITLNAGELWFQKIR